MSHTILNIFWHPRPSLPLCQTIMVVLVRANPLSTKVPTPYLLVVIYECPLRKSLCSSRWFWGWPCQWGVRTTINVLQKTVQLITLNRSKFAVLSAGFLSPWRQTQENGFLGLRAPPPIKLKYFSRLSQSWKRSTVSVQNLDGRLFKFNVFSCNLRKIVLA